MRQIEIYCTNTASYHTFPLATSLSKIVEELKIELPFPVCGALVNHKPKDLTFEIIKPKRIQFIDYTNPEGARMYFRSLMFLLYHTVDELFPEADLTLQHAISNGYYCEIENLNRPVTDEDIFSIKNSVIELTHQALPFVRKGIETQAAIKMFNDSNLTNKADLLQEKGDLYSYVYFLDQKINFFYGHLVPDTSYITHFDIEHLNEGFLIRMPNPDKPKELLPKIDQQKLFTIFQEHKDWAEIHNISYLNQLNCCTQNNQIGNVVKISEALHERRIVEIANKINDHHNEVKIVLIAGPSSSGKTTFSKRLAIQLAVSGLQPQLLSLDDYFVNREQTPLDEKGEYDFEALNAIDIPYFNQNMLDLMAGKKIQLPQFDFKTGSRVFSGETMKLNSNSVLIIEGIHALNPDLIPLIDTHSTFKIFISALTQINIDKHNYIPTTDNRLVRRILRDSKYRNYSASETIKRWPSVRRGEERNIFPHQENADEMFNSALIYELAALKRYVTPLLQQIQENEEEYTDAIRLLKFFSHLKEINTDEVPPTSIIREFLGGSSFTY